MKRNPRRHHRLRAPAPHLLEFLVVAARLLPRGSRGGGRRLPGSGGVRAVVARAVPGLAAAGLTRAPPEVVAPDRILVAHVAHDVARGARGGGGTSSRRTPPFALREVAKGGDLFVARPHGKSPATAPSHLVEREAVAQCVERARRRQVPPPERRVARRAEEDRVRASAVAHLYRAWGAVVGGRACG